MADDELNVLAIWVLPSRLGRTEQNPQLLRVEDDDLTILWRQDVDFVLPGGRLPRKPASRSFLPRKAREDALGRQRFHGYRLM